MKDILVIANFCGDLSENGNGRFMYLCDELSKYNKVELITSDFDHRKKIHRKSLADKWSFKISCLHEPGYQKNISVWRFFSHLRWGISVNKYLKNRNKPDVIYCAIPSLTASLVASKYCQINAVKFIIDVQDIWPEAFKMVFRVPIISDLIFLPFKICVDKIYMRADEIIAVSDTYVRRALSVNKKCIIGHTVFLGTKLERFDEGASGIPMYLKNDNKIWIGYCGSLSASYDIPTLLHAVKKLYEKEIVNIKIIIMGDGAFRQQFENIAKTLDIDVIFTGKLPYDKMCAQLKECDIVVNPIKKGSAASIINKHADYAASGLPVLNSQDSQEYRDLIDNYHMGVNCKNEDSVDMANKLEYLIKNYSVRIEMGKNARLCAEERFDRKNSYIKILNIITE